jgi:ParB-like chromosome segregation protein Spo0J
MSGHHKFPQLTEGFSPQRQADISRRTALLKEEMALAELQQALQLTHTELAEKLQLQQLVVTNMEQHADTYISHLRQIVEAMGGQLEIVARFPDGEVKITNFSQFNNS